MTDAIEFGPEIPRDAAICGGHWPPKWLADDAWDNVVAILEGGRVQYPNKSDTIRRTSEWGWGGIFALRFPLSHPASIAQRWNDDNPDMPPFDRVWFGGEHAPDDYNGSAVLCNTSEVRAGWRWDWRADPSDGYGNRLIRVVAYRSKPSEQTVEDDGRLTEAEVRAIVGGFDAAERMVAALYCRNQIRPETPVERFKRENPGCDDWTRDEVIEAAVKFGGGL